MKSAPEVPASGVSVFLDNFLSTTSLFFKSYNYNAISRYGLQAKKALPKQDFRFKIQT